jgi:hypothetical protein
VEITKSGILNQAMNAVGNVASVAGNAAGDVANAVNVAKVVDTVGYAAMEVATSVVESISNLLILLVYLII